MSKDISARLSRVRDSAATLNQLCDQAADSVRMLEEFLARECSVGVEVEVRVWFDEDESHAESLYLCYGRWGVRFRVFLKWTNTHTPCDETRSWAECKREDKLRSLPFLIDLIDKIDDELMTQIKKAKEAISEISNLTSSVTGGKNADKK